MDMRASWRSVKISSMRKATAIAIVVIVVAAGLMTAVPAMRLSGALRQLDAAAGGDDEERGNAGAVIDAAFWVADVDPSPGPAPATAPASPAAATEPRSLSPVDAFLATRAGIEGRLPDATPPYGSPLSSADIAGLLASDPGMQAALLDLSRDADPEVRREAVQFLAGFEGAD